jgi:hypothetical protein
VVILSTHTTAQLDKWFGRKCNTQNNFWIVAESGYLYKTGMSQEWMPFAKIDNSDW